MRYSAFLLIPLLWGASFLQDVVVGVHNMDLGYVAIAGPMSAGAFTMVCCWPLRCRTVSTACGRLLNDFIHKPTVGLILKLGAVHFSGCRFTVIGFIALIGGVNQQFPLQ